MSYLSEVGLVVWHKQMITSYQALFIYKMYFPNKYSLYQRNNIRWMDETINRHKILSPCMNDCLLDPNENIPCFNETILTNSDPSYEVHS